MMRVICGVCFIAFAMLAIVGFSRETAGEEARPNANLERLEVSAVKAPRAFLIETLSALQQGNAQRAKEAFEAYDSAWNGIEVYISTRSRALYQVLELELQARITKALGTPHPDMAALIADVQAMIAKYDEAIDIVTKASPLNPLYDELARLR